jgi:hypothetical protein
MKDSFPFFFRLACFGFIFIELSLSLGFRDLICFKLPLDAPSGSRGPHSWAGFSLFIRNLLLQRSSFRILPKILSKIQESLFPLSLEASGGISSDSGLIPLGFWEMVLLFFFRLASWVLGFSGIFSIGPLSPYGRFTLGPQSHRAGALPLFLQLDA